MKLPLVLITASAVLVTGAAAGEPKPYRNETNGFSLLVPDGWSDPAAADGMTTTSADGAVRCSVTAQADEATKNETQDAINARISATYTGDSWERQFLGNGTEGQIESSGITRIEQWDAPWAKGWLRYPQQTARFGVILFQTPGRIISLTCIGETASYDKNNDDVVTVLNNLRPV